VSGGAFTGLSGWLEHCSRLIQTHLDATGRRLKRVPLLLLLAAAATEADILRGPATKRTALGSALIRVNWVCKPRQLRL
jgi:hypothetical protein